MSVNQNAISNLSKDKYTIKAKSTQTISFMGASPNYYRITNGGATPLYLGVSMMPTEDFFDQKIPATTTKLYVDAYGHHEIYIYNPSVTDANIVITSFTAPFDPTTLGLSDIGQDFSSIEFTGEVEATGDLKRMIANINNITNNMNTDTYKIYLATNKIKETVLNNETKLNEIYNSFGSHLNQMTPDINSILSNVNEILTKQNSILEEIQKVKNVIEIQTEVNVETRRNEHYQTFMTFQIMDETQEIELYDIRSIPYIASEGEYPTEITFYKNDEFMFQYIYNEGDENIFKDIIFEKGITAKVYVHEGDFIKAIFTLYN